MGSIVVRESNGETRVVASEAYQYEEILQRNIGDIPKLIPLDLVTEHAVEHLTIGYEWNAGGGAADIVMLGSDAILTVVETKLKRNPEARREVVAQILEYAAYLSEWTMLDISQQAQEFLATDMASSEYRGKTFDDALAQFLKDADLGVESFKSKIEQNLRRGKLRLIVAVDEVSEQAQKLVTFVNTYSSFDIYLLQISSYRDGDQNIFVPSLYGYARKAPSSARKVQWGWDKYENEPLWDAEVLERAKVLVARLTELNKGGAPIAQFHETWVDLVCFGHDGVIGVEVQKRTGVNLYFWLEENPETSLPQGVLPRQRKHYLYLSGNLEELDDKQLHGLCEAALKKDGWGPAD